MLSTSIAMARKAQVLAEALPYIRSFHGKTFVIKFDGNAITSAALRSGFGRDITLLQLVGMRPIVVQGGEFEIADLLNRIGVKGEGRRRSSITDGKTMNLVTMAFAELNKEVVGLINQHGGKAVGLSGQDSRFIRAKKSLLPSAVDEKGAVDIGLTGDVERIDPEVLDLLRSNDFIPVVSPIGVGAKGDLYNINADIVAGNLAQTLKAEKLIIMTNTPGILDTQGRLITGLTVSEMEPLIAGGAIHGGTTPTLSAALEAVKNGVKAAHIIDGRVRNALLLEVLTGEGVGTAIRSNAGPHFLADTQRYFSEAV